MIFIAFGRWNHSAGRWLIRERIWWRTCPLSSQAYCWTPFVRVRWRYEFAMHAAYALPRCIVNWALIRAWAHATTGPWSDEEVSSVTASEMIKRWEKETVQ